MKRKTQVNLISITERWMNGFWEKDPQQRRDI